MPLKKTSIQIDAGILDDLRVRYPDLTRSEIIRLCVEYVYETRPEIEKGKTRFVKSDQTESIFQHFQKSFSE